MELLIGALVTIFAQAYKWIIKRIGFEMAKTWTLIVVFALTASGVFAWKWKSGALDWSNYEEIFSVFGLAIAYYEIIIKRVFMPVFNKFKK